MAYGVGVGISSVSAVGVLLDDQSAADSFPWWGRGENQRISKDI